MKADLRYIVLVFVSYCLHFSLSDSDVTECTCAKKQFTCATSSCTCIPIEWKCDSDNDCGDQSDEEGCFSGAESCGSDYFRCANGLCVSNKWKCDGANDCGDDSDEQSCGDYPEKNCPEGHFLCDNNEKCVVNNWRCDGEQDCSDGSDEHLCDMKNSEVIAINVTCQHDEFSCEQFGECILSSYRCDGDDDCSDSSDEFSCYDRCEANEFRCASGQCVPQTNRCDGSEDCGDASDEAECVGREEKTCMVNEFQCANGVCISDTWRCDDAADCDDNSDETNCDVSLCDSEHFQCARTSQCIKLSWKCDGEQDCVDSSDEEDCGNTSGVCSDDQFACDNGQCIGIHKLCDGNQDCFDLSDEPPKFDCNSNNGKRPMCSGIRGHCQHFCQNTTFGAKCMCHRGFKLAVDGNSCLDLNECLVESTCSQKCINTNGSYTCSCSDGYILRYDRRSCIAKGPELSLLFANRIDIRNVQIGQTDVEPVVHGLENAVAIDYHLKKKLIFWSDVTQDQIKSSYVNGSNVKDIVTGGLQSPSGVAVDWIHDLLYWTDSGTSRIEVSKLSGQYRKVLLWEKLQKPRAIVVHPHKCLVFWTDWGISPRLESAWMDGRNRKVLTTKDLYWPNGLTLDLTLDQIYWVDAKHHVIERIDTDGKNRKTVITRGLPHPFAITVFEDKLYWTDWDTKSINRANKFTGNGLRSIHNHLHFPMGIQAYHPLRQPEGESQCAQSECTQLCLPNPYGHSCACQTGYRLINTTHCAVEIKEFLVFARKNEIRRISYDADNHSDSVIPLKKLESAIALDWDNDGYLYWSDVGSDTINRAKWDGSNQDVVISSNLDSPAGLAIDWINHKIYWTDAGLNRIEVSLLDGSTRCVLVWMNLYRPRDIVLLPSKGYMFWSDWGDEPKIERSSMDGKDRVAIVVDNLKSPNGLALDFAEERLYWADSGLHIIESCAFDGSSRQKIRSNNMPHPFGLALHKDRIYWTDWSLNKIQSANKITGQDHQILRENLEYLMDIHYYDANRPPSYNPCNDRNGNCSQLCLLSSSNENKPTYSCACPIGLALGSDGKTCNSHMNKFIAVARRTDIRVISLDVPYTADIKLSLSENLINVVEIAVDPVEGYLYWSDIGSRSIAKTKMSSFNRESKIIMQTGLGTVDGLAIDHMERKMYWTDADRELVMVSQLDGSSRKSIVYENLDSPRAIVLHHASGYLYWTDWGSLPKIERIGMDGTNRSIIISKDLVWPNGLTIDEEQNLLIWGDAHIEVIESSDLLGGNRRILKVSTPHPYSLTAMDGFLYWTDWQTRNVERLNLRNLTQSATMRKQLPNIMGIKAVTLQLNKNIDEIENRRVCTGKEGCTHLCLRSPTSKEGYRCACPTGIKLHSDMKTCSNIPEQFLLFTSRNEIRRLSLDTDENVYVQLPIPGLENVIAVDYHYRKKILYFTDVYHDIIRSSKFDGSDAKTVVEGDLKTMDGIAVDWIADNLYWTDTGPNTISVSRMDGTKRKTVVKNALDEPRAIALHPLKGKMFWTDWGNKAKIESSYLDGNNRKVLISNGIVWPNGLTVDVIEGRIFWVDAHSSMRKVESCDLQGRNRTVVMSNVLHGFSISYMNSRLYWTDWKTHAIETLNLRTGSDHRTKLLGGIEGLMDIKAVSAEQQQGSNACDASKGYGGCKDLCLMQGAAKSVCVRADDTSHLPLSTRPTPKLTSIRTKPPHRFSTKSNPILTSSLETPSSPDHKSYFLWLLAVLLSVFVILTIFGILAWRYLLSKKLRTGTQADTIDVTFQLNHGYTTGSQNTLLTRLEMRSSGASAIEMKMTNLRSSSRSTSAAEDSHDQEARQKLLPQIQDVPEHLSNSNTEIESAPMIEPANIEDVHDNISLISADVITSDSDVKL
ncbi:low-density lipoprotein receptor-related protein 4-like isoform X1 [Styela clava]